jgi:hypothetical protein
MAESFVGGRIFGKLDPHFCTCLPINIIQVGARLDVETSPRSLLLPRPYSPPNNNNNPDT